jgi:ParB family transcriptional regulator, chromosome partitioning protein
MARIPPKLSGLIKSGAVVAVDPVQRLADISLPMAVETSQTFHIPSRDEAGVAGSHARRMVRDIEIELIDPNPLAPRSIYTAEMIQARANDLQAQGQHDPIHVTPNPEAPGRYIICDGWTRVQACRVHGTFKTLRAEIHPELKGVDSAIFGYQQNEGRKQHNDYDRAQFFEKLKASGLSAAEISRLTGIPENRLSMYKALARLPAIVLQQVQKAPERFGYNAGAQLARLCSADVPQSDPGVMRAAELAEAYSAGDRSFKWLKSHCDAFLTHKPRVQSQAGMSLRYREGYLRGRGDTLQLELRLETAEQQQALLEELRNFLSQRGIFEDTTRSDKTV